MHWSMGIPALDPRHQLVALADFGTEFHTVYVNGQTGEVVRHGPTLSKADAHAVIRGDLPPSFLRRRAAAKA